MLHFISKIITAFRPGKRQLEFQIKASVWRASSLKKHPQLVLNRTQTLYSPSKHSVITGIFLCPISLSPHVTQQYKSEISYTLYNLNLSVYRFMGADCLFYNSLVNVLQSSDLSVVPTGVQHREISEGMGHLWVPSHPQRQQRQNGARGQ